VSRKHHDRTVLAPASDLQALVALCRGWSRDASDYRTRDKPFRARLRPLRAIDPRRMLAARIRAEKAAVSESNAFGELLKQAHAAYGGAFLLAEDTCHKHKLPALFMVHVSERSGSRHAIALRRGSHLCCLSDAQYNAHEQHLRCVRAAWDPERIARGNALMASDRRSYERWGQFHQARSVLEESLRARLPACDYNPDRRSTITAVWLDERIFVVADRGGTGSSDGLFREIDQELTIPADCRATAGDITVGDYLAAEGVYVSPLPAETKKLPLCKLASSVSRKQKPPWLNFYAYHLAPFLPQRRGPREPE
jgi:hypothetical protein